MDEIPFNRPTMLDSALPFLHRVLATRHISGSGPFTQQCETILEKVLSVERVLLTTSCTHALELAALLLDIRPGDEVIIPSYTFISTANAFVLRGARPIFADVRPDTLNIDEAHVQSLITSRTRAIVPVHYGGVGCEMDAINALAKKCDIAVVEDNAHGLFGKYHGRYLGTIGDLATLSFHETKNFTCGEGGALLINDGRFPERAEIIRDKGTDRSRFLRGQVDKYTWVDVGSSYGLSDMLAALLLSQLEVRGRIQAQRRRLWNNYMDQLREWAGTHGIGLPLVPSHCEQAYHIFYLITRSLDDRNRLIDHLGMRGIGSAFHYQPLHGSEMGQSFGGEFGDCPVAEAAGDCLLRLPLYFDLTEAEQDRVIEGVRSFRPASLHASRIHRARENFTPAQATATAREPEAA